MWHLLGGIYLGWSLGANDTANVFGTAVTSKMVRFGTAAALSSLFVCLGAILEGGAGIETIRSLSSQSLETATLTAVSAAISITFMTILRIPSSTSQAVVGSILGIGIFSGSLQLGGLPKILICWVGTPLGAIPIAMILYKVMGGIFNRARPTLYTQDVFLRFGLVLAGCYGAYALGANNVANVTGVYASAGLLDPFGAALVGAGSIALGVITFSQPVMNTVGRSIIKLDAFSALVVVLAEAITVHIYAWVGVPVSTSQAVVGAVIGVGLVKQASAIRTATIKRVVAGWIATPVIAFGLAILLHFLTHLKYVP